MVSALDSGFEPWPGHFLVSWARHLILTVSLSPPRGGGGGDSNIKKCGGARREF